MNYVLHFRYRTVRGWFGGETVVIDEKPVAGDAFYISVLKASGKTPVPFILT